MSRKKELETGRKFWLSLLGMALSTFRPEAAPAIAAIVLAFNGANAAVEWKYALARTEAQAAQVKP